MRVRLDAFEMFYSVSGAGPPVVLIHGFPLDHTMWQPQVDELSKDHVVITADLRGHGQSQATPGPYSMDLLADDVNMLLDHLGLGQVVLGGLSMGGYVAFAFFRKYQQRVRALILVDTRAEADTPEAKARREQQAQAVLKDGPGNLVNQMIVKMFTQKTILNDTTLVERVRKMMESTSSVGAVGALQGMAQRPDSTLLLESIRVPTLIIVGSEDSLTTVSDAQRMAGRIPGSELVIVPEAAHFTTLEKPRGGNAAVCRFLPRMSL